MIHANSATRYIGLLALTSLLVFTRVAVAGTETNASLRADEQAVIFLERTGRYDEAEARSIQMLQQNPNDVNAKRLLAEVEDAKHKPHPSTALRETLDEIIIPEVNFREVGVADVIEFLRTESQKISGADYPINFVWQASAESFKTTKVTLDLRRVPLADVLKYVTESAGLRYRVDPRAVVIYQPPPAAPTGSSPSNVKTP
ncbi:MAG: STN domain-containing protein [Verrucomicrobiia bacterium]